MINLRALSEGKFDLFYYGVGIPEHTQAIEFPVLPDAVFDVPTDPTAGPFKMFRMARIPVETFIGPDGQRIKIGISAEHNLVVIGDALIGRNDV